LRSIDRSDVDDSIRQEKKQSVEVGIFQTEFGNVVFSFFERSAPLSVENFKKLILYGHYNGGSFYRAEKNFVLQGGIPSGKTSPFGNVPLEYSIPNRKGMVSMARTNDPNSGSTEFAIQLNDNSTSFTVFVSSRKKKEKEMRINSKQQR